MPEVGLINESVVVCSSLLVFSVGDSLSKRQLFSLQKLPLSSPRAGQAVPHCVAAVPRGSSGAGITGWAQELWVRRSGT